MKDENTRCATAGKTGDSNKKPKKQGEFIMTIQNTKPAVQKIEVRSNTNDNVIVSFDQSHEGETNIITAGYNKVCAMFGIDRMNAENRYYVTKA